MLEPVARRATEIADHVAAHAGELAPSSFWQEYAQADVDALEAFGFATFKRSVNAHYFQWPIGNTRDPRYRAVAARRSAAVLTARPIGGLDGWIAPGPGRRRRAALYTRYVAHLWELARDVAGPEVADRLEEPDLGSPVLVRHRGKRISQDLANSLTEYASIAGAIPAGALEGGRYLEIGGGYGRLADLFLRLVPGLRVVMVDVAPALAIAEAYLTALHPERRTLRFSPELDLDALDASELAFLTPDQLRAARPVRADLCVNVSSLHEMLPEQVAAYLAEIDRHGVGWFFTKQWDHWENAHDQVVARRDAYPYPASWTTLFERPCAAHPEFFEALMDVRP